MARSQEELRQAAIRNAAENPPIPPSGNLPMHIPINPPVGAYPPPEGGPMNQNYVPTIKPHILGRVSVDDHHDIFYDALGSLIMEMEMKFHVLEDKMKAFQGPDTFGLDV